MPVVWRKLVSDNRWRGLLLRWLLLVSVVCLPTCLVLSPFANLLNNKLINCRTQLHGALYHREKRVPSRIVVSDELIYFLSELKPCVNRQPLQLLKQVDTLRGAAYEDDDVVKLADRPTAAPVDQLLALFPRHSIKLLLKDIYWIASANHNCLDYEVDNMADTADTSMTVVEAKIGCKPLHTGVVIRRVICCEVAELVLNGLALRRQSQRYCSHCESRDAPVDQARSSRSCRSCQ